jgi:hypothetical protein
MTCRLSGDGWRYDAETDRTRSSWTERLRLLRELMNLLCDDLDELLELLELHGDDLQQLLKLDELLLLEELQLLELLRHDLQQLQNLLQWLLYRADSIPTDRLARERLCIGREAPGNRGCGIHRRRADSERRSCKLTHVTSSVSVFVTVLIREATVVPQLPYQSSKSSPQRFLAIDRQAVCNPRIVICMGSHQNHFEIRFIRARNGTARENPMSVSIKDQAVDKIQAVDKSRGRTSAA